MKANLLLADKMREMTASAQYRKAVKEMQKLQSTFSNQRYIMLHNPNDQTIEMLKDQGFTVSRTQVKEYVQYKILW